MEFQSGSSNPGCASEQAFWLHCGCRSRGIARLRHRNRGRSGLLVLRQQQAQARREAGTPRKGGEAEKAEKVKDKAFQPQPVHLIVISIAKQRISIYGSGGLLAQSAISSGQAGHRTPTGVFSVIQKNRFHRSNIYSGAPMPYMQRITWSGIALHAGVIPGYPASHGCIRLPHHFAAELWGMTKMGARVIVAPEDTAAVELVSPRLPLPTLTPAPEGTSDQAKPELVSMALGGPRTEGVDAPKSATPRLLNPLERARAAKTRTAAAALATGKAAKAATELSAARAAQANKAIAGLRNAELALAKAQTKLDAAIKALDAVKTPEAAERGKAPSRLPRQRSRKPARPARRRARWRPWRPRGAGRGPHGLGRRERQPDCRRGGQGRRARHRPDLHLHQQEDGPPLHPPGLGTDPRGRRQHQGARGSDRHAHLSGGGAGGRRQEPALAVGDVPGRQAGRPQR